MYVCAQLDLFSWMLQLFEIPEIMFVSKNKYKHSFTNTDALSRPATFDYVEDACIPLTTM